MQGGVFQIRNTGTGRHPAALHDRPARRQNRFQFAQMTGSCTDYALQAEWGRDGKAFVFEVLEELTQKETQTEAEFKADIDALFELWQEKLADAPQY